MDMQVVYLLGITPRSGTNFFYDLLLLHPECGAPKGTPSEDYFFAYAHHLDEYVNDLYGKWEGLWGWHEQWEQTYGENGEKLKGPMLHALGEGLDNYLARALARENVESEKIGEEQPTVCIARTPSVEGLNFVEGLTNSKVVIIVRDGRSVVESGMRSFGWWFEDALHRWQRGAKLIIDVADNNPQMMYVRYEDLLNDKKEEELRKIFSFIGVDPDNYDYQEELAVRGSSSFFDKDKGLNWGKTEKTKDFNPLYRWRKWSNTRKERFYWLAGEQLQAFGYEVDSNPGVGMKLYNTLADVLWPINIASRKFARQIIPKDLRGKIRWRRGARYRTKTLKNRSG